MKTLRQRVAAIIAEANPMLGLHGGAIELVSVSKGIVSIRFKGACVGCAAANITLEYGLKELIMMQCEEVLDVVAVNTEPVTHEAPSTPLPYARRS